MVSHWGAIAAVVVGTVVAIVGFVLGWYVFPNIVDDQIAENVVLKTGTDQFERFEELPIPLDFKVYIFDVKNPEKVNSGEEKPKVEEKGPYVYKQSRKKTNITRNGNSISYYEYLDFSYDQAKSGNLKEEDEITVLNPALNGAIQILDMTGLSMLLPFLSSTADLTFGEKNIFLKTTVKEFLFVGYKICQIDKIKNNPDITIRQKADSVIACLGLFVMPTKNIRPNINANNEVELVFTFLAHKLKQHDGHYTVNSGIGDVNQLGWIERWEDKDYLRTWTGGSESKCNEVRGRDAVIFQPHITDKSSLTVFNTDICRTVDLRYTNDKVVRDVTALEFELGEDAFRASTEEHRDEMCYCLNVTGGITQENGCTKNGMLELFTCYNAPILLSYPHLMYADKEYKDAVEGLHPELDKHKTFAILEPNTGTPLGGSKRVQFNMFVRDIQDSNGDSLVDFLRGYRGKETLLPLIWLDEGFEITDDLYQILYDTYISKTYIIDAVTWALIGVGFAVIVITLIVFFVLKTRESKQTV